MGIRCLGELSKTTCRHRLSDLSVHSIVVQEPLRASSWNCLRSPVDIMFHSRIIYVHLWASLYIVKLPKATCSFHG